MDFEKIFLKQARPTSIGGQAIIEGVMMRGPEDIAIAVRKPDSEIEVKKEKVSPLFKSKIAKTPLIRGVFALIDSMVVGVRALTYSAEFYEEEEDYKKSKFELWIENKFGDKTGDILIYMSVFFALVMGVGLFIITPTLLTQFVKKFTTSNLALNLAEGFVRIFMFVAYIVLISRMKDIQRVFQYHGAEHKTIHCYESGQPLTVENVKKFTTLHPRCGTSFLMIVMIISLILFSTIGWPSVMMRVLSRFVLIPVVGGISYEIIKWAGKRRSKFICMISYPGLLMQKLTTKEPDDKQIEVAIKALESVIVKDEEMDLW
ncbi:DUF1385 domain-containing protein [Anaeromicrobium sediminis]|nr:DUF1385 domain-containing protein [Anaeromicrobium sediminis]